MSADRMRGPGWTAGVSIAPQTKTVEVMGVMNSLATVRDGFGATHIIRTDVLRSKSKPPVAGEIWYVDKMLGGWAFQAVVGYKTADLTDARAVLLAQVDPDTDDPDPADLTAAIVTILLSLSDSA